VKQAFVRRRFSAESRALIDTANTIIEEYQQQGFELTLRQLYYQFVVRGLLPNTERSYKNLGSVIGDGRMAGLVDWDAISDRTRHLRSLTHWKSPREVAEAAVGSYRLDKWEKSGVRPEVWIEKDALIGVIEDICNSYDVACLSCRGYLSLSEVYAASRRITSRYVGRIPQQTLIIHLGDHDPSGMDMSRDIANRLSLMTPADSHSLTRLALNMDQVKEHKPPPNPAKLSDSRCSSYVRQYGDKSWELDALEPQVIQGLVHGAIGFVLKFPDIKRNYSRQQTAEKRGRKALTELAKQAPVAP
jgi:hypothetical protein